MHKRSKLKCVFGLFFILANVLNVHPASKSQELDSLRLIAKKLVSVNIDSANQVVDAIFEELDKSIDSLVLADIYSVKSSLLFSQGNYEGALEYELKSLAIRTEFKDSVEMARCYQMLGNIYYYTEALDKSIFYVKRGLSMYSSYGSDSAELVPCYNTLGLVFYETDQNDSAYHYFDIGFECIENSKKPKAEYLSNLGILLSSYALVLSYTKEYEKALVLLDSALQIDIELGNNESISWDYLRIAATKLEARDLDGVYEYLQKADSFAEVSSSLETKQDLRYHFAQYFTLTGQKDSALNYLLEFAYFSDSVQTMTTEQNIQEMEAKYQVKEKDAALALSNEKRERLKAQNEAKERLMWLVGSVFAILTIMGIIVIRNYRHRNKIAAMELEIKDNKFDELMASQEAKTLSAMLKGQEKERERVAQDLHDRLGGTLAALKMALRKQGNKVDQEDLEILDEAVAEVRNISHNLSSGLLDKYGLNEAIQQLFKTIEQSGELMFHVVLHPDIASLGQSVGIELYRIIQELLTNTIKHAQATEISVQTNFDGNTFNLIFEDNGVGFDSSKMQGGIGMQNIRKRVEKINGVLHIDAAIGRGSIFIIEIQKKA